MDLAKARAEIKELRRSLAADGASVDRRAKVDAITAFAKSLSGGETALRAAREEIQGVSPRVARVGGSRGGGGGKDGKAVGNLAVAAAALAAEAEDLVTVPSEVEAFEKRTDREIKASPDDTRGKLALYCDMELFRLQYTSRSHVQTFLDERARAARRVGADAELKALDAAHPAIRETVERLDALRNRLRLSKPPRRTMAETVAAAVRPVLFFVWSMLSMPFFYPASILRLFHPILRMIGVKNGNLPLDLLQTYVTRVGLMIMGVRVKYRNVNKALKNAATGTVGMLTHSSNLDPLIVSAGPLRFHFVGKRIVFMIPVIGWIMYLWGHVPIDRRNLRQAKATINDTLVKKIRRWGRSIAISPEGTRSKTGRLKDFKKGAFHLAANVRLPVTPILIDGAWKLNPPGSMLLFPGDVTMEYLEPIEVRDEDDHASLSRRVHRAMIEGMQSDKKGGWVEYPNGLGVWIVFLVPLLWLCFLFWQYKRYFG